MKKPAYQTILLGGLIAGTLDITYACVFSYIRSGRKPLFILQSVASGALGRRSFEGGAKTAALRLAFYFLIALICADFYYLAGRLLRFMGTHAVIRGILFCLCLFLSFN